MSGESKLTNGRASGRVLTSQFLVVVDHGVVWVELNNDGEVD